MGLILYSSYHLSSVCSCVGLEFQTIMHSVETSRGNVQSFKEGKEFYTDNKGNDSFT